ncbi:hypothetical protein Goshw_016511 [Gossypium schwendimanii]|uniref:Uncharacterized protein n=2 Tax=Gossypium TaxID=3633 RepID=A0A7J9KSS9_GOSSC|nr:hypothetical protein [Gossypium laxum]MBA0849474.1 hypothetical protein [Gossypium schwendimanii]
MRHRSGEPSPTSPAIMIPSVSAVPPIRFWRMAVCPPLSLSLTVLPGSSSRPRWVGGRIAGRIRIGG